MSRRAVLVLVVLTVVASVALVALGGPSPVRSSTLSREAAGVLAARRYLEARGASVELTDRPFAERPGKGGVWVTLLPWQYQTTGQDEDALSAHVRTGGMLVLGYSGDRQGFAEDRLAETFSLEWRAVRGTPPLAPLAWRGYASEEWTLVPAADLAGAAPLQVAAPRRVPVAPRGAQVLFRDPDGRPAVFEMAVGRGRVLVLPSDALSNGRLLDAGNASLLERLRQDLGDRWVVDEHHHGRLSAATAAQPAPRRALDLLLVHGLLAYALLVLALLPRFGPSWVDPPVVAGSTRLFLVSLGALHARAGHHGEAARLLADRAVRWQPGLPAITIEAARDQQGLLGLARQLALRLRRRDT